VIEELLFCLQSLGRTTSNNIFKKIVHYMKICGIEWGGDVTEFAPMERMQLLENTLELLPKLKKLILILNLLAVVALRLKKFTYFILQKLKLAVTRGI
jgi:hypothetical protein